MVNWFLKNIHQLEEQYRDEDLLGLDDEVSEFSDRLNHSSSWTIIWLIWGFWTGKSNFLKQVQRKNQEGGTSKWFEFDAWKYPDRNHLWESFVLEIAEQRWLLQNILNKIEGKGYWKKIIKLLFQVLTWGSNKDVIDVFIIGSPAKRTFQIQKILNDLLDNIDEENIYIVIEDIDRSGDSGIYFLETLNHFFKNNFKSEKKVRIIVPISDKKYEESRSAYLKCLDITHNFFIWLRELWAFLEHTIDPKLLDEKNKNMLLRFLNSIWKNSDGEMNMRLMKKIFRNADNQFVVLQKKWWEWIDWRMVLLFEFAKNTHIKWETWDKMVNYLQGSTSSVLNVLLNEILKEKTNASISFDRPFAIQQFNWNEKTKKDIRIESDSDNNISIICILSDYYR